MVTQKGVVVSLEKYQNTIQGRVAIGEKNKEKGYPVKLDYFIFTRPFDSKANLAPRFPEMTEVIKKKYATDKPKKVEVTFVFDHYDEVFYTDYLNYPGKKCNCKGNGRTAMRVINDAGDKKEVPCDYKACQFRMTKTDRGVINTCKPTGILTFMMPEAPVSGGVWKFVTHSEMTIGKISGALKNIYDIRKTLYGLCVNLKVVIVPITIKGQVQNVPTVEIEVPFSWDQIAEGAGTKIGTLMEARAKYMTLGCAPDPELKKELAKSAETLAYTGAMDDVVVIDAEIASPEPTVKDSDPLTSSDSDEFQF